jgi:DNA-binding transcriptional ArsR family regulator
MMPKVTRSDAEIYATWFKALADPTRIQVLNLLAAAGREMTVGEIVDGLPVGQSTVSHHLRILTEVRFLLVRADGNANYYRLNTLCVDEFPSAADVIIGRRPTVSPDIAASRKRRR